MILNVQFIFWCELLKSALLKNGIFYELFTNTDNGKKLNNYFRISTKVDWNRLVLTTK